MQFQDQSKFFLTRQSATIMDDLHRRLNVTTSISLLHGVRGIGKSQLLKQFHRRLANADSVLIQFKPTNCFVIAGGEEFATDIFLKQVFTKLAAQSTILLDQFDIAPMELQQKILMYWERDLQHENINLIISVQSNSLQQLKDWSRRYHLQIECVELMPLNYQEQIEYLRSTCCPEIRQVAVINAGLKKKLKLTNGLFSQLEAFRFQYGDEINCQNILISSRLKSGQVLVASFLGFLILAMSLFLFQGNFLNIEPALEATSLPENSEKKTGSADSNTYIEVDSKHVDESAGSSTTGQQQAYAGEVIKPEINLLNKAENTKHLQIELFEKEEALPIAVAVENENRKLTVDEQKVLTVFQQRFLATEHWLNSVDINSASIQIMTLSKDKNHQKALNRYLEMLKQKQVDLEQIKIYLLSKSGNKMYGVLYGEFKDLKLAYSEINRLPEILKANKPFARTVKGIKEEVIDFDDIIGTTSTP